jgi:hypothetical protein
LSGIKAINAVLAEIVGLCEATRRGLLPAPNADNTEGLHLPANYRIAVLIVYRSGDDARRCQAKDQVFFTAAGSEGQDFPAGAAPRRSKILLLVSVASRRQGVSARLYPVNRETPGAIRKGAENLMLPLQGHEVDRNLLEAFARSGLDNRALHIAQLGWIRLGQRCCRHRFLPSGMRSESA